MTMVFYGEISMGLFLTKAFSVLSLAQRLAGKKVSEMTYSVSGGT